MFASNSSHLQEEPNYIESCFSTYLYTGNGSTQTINNGIDLAGKGGLVWIKSRGQIQSINPGHLLYDTARGTGSYLQTDTTAGNGSLSNCVTSFNSNGFSLGNFQYSNNSGSSFSSWTFRRAPKFFDVVTYTGNGVAGRQIPHSLKSVPGCIIVKSTTRVDGWAVYHRSIGATKFLTLNTTGDAVTDSLFWSNSEPTDTAFTVGTEQMVNAVGQTYVAYLFAHNAGGFGLTGTDNVISCGSFTTDGSGNATVNLGWEPQFLLVKRTDSSTAGSWIILDQMRGFPGGKTASTTPYAQGLIPNSSSAEGNADMAGPTATGFAAFGWPASSTVIYIAIRRGPMKVPTDGTKVFAPTAVNNATGTQNTTSFPIDLQIFSARAGFNKPVVDRLRGVSSNTTESGQYLQTTTTNAEAAGTVTLGWDNTGFKTASGYASADMIYWNFRRAPGFFDEVCYTGTGSARTVNHNLGVVPELMIVKNRTTAGYYWHVYSAALGNANIIYLNTTGDGTSSGAQYWNNTSPTATTFTTGAAPGVSESGSNFVAYLFASCPGVSKVGSYTGTGTTQQINCGFTAGARFVLIKRTDSTGDWYVWDSARGIVAGNDPYLLLNSTAAEVTSTDYVDSYSAGFEISSTAPAAINANGGTFIYLAIA